MSKYLMFIAIHAALTAVVFATGRALLRAIGRRSESRRVHGRYVLGWSVGAFATGPLILLAVAEGPSHVSVPAEIKGSYVYGMFSLLAGWLVGTLHGAVVLAARRDERRA